MAAGGAGRVRSTGYSATASSRRNSRHRVGLAFRARAQRPSGVVGN
jgi:hypothetical protein